MPKRLQDSFTRLLRWSEKYTKIDMVYLFSGGFWLTFGQILYSLCAIVLAVVLANILPKEIYGTYKYVLSVAGIFAIFPLPGMITAVTRAVAQKKEGTFLPAAFAQMRWGLLGALVGLLIAVYYWHAGNLPLAGSILIIAVFLPVFDPLNLYSAYLYGQKDFRRSTWWGFFIQAGAAAALIITAFFWQNFLILILVYFISFTLLRGIFFRLVLREVPAGAPSDPKALSYGRHLSFMTVLTQVAGQVDTIILFHFLGAAQVAVYSIAIAPAEQLKAFLGFINPLLLPRFAGYSEQQIRASIWYKSFLLFIMITASIAAYIFVVPFFMHIFFPKYSDAIFPSQIFVLSMFNVVLTPVGVFLQSHGKVRELYWSNTLSAIVQIGLMVAGTYYWGLIGLVLARVLTRYLGALINLFLYLVPLTPQAGA